MKEPLKLAELSLIAKLGGPAPEDGQKPSTEYTASIGYVLSIRGDAMKQRVGFTAHQQQFDEYMWNVDGEELTKAINDSGLFDVEYDEDNPEDVEAKKG